MKLRKKLRSRRGVTMAEMLVAIAVMGLVMSVVVTGIGAAGKVRRDSTAVSQSQMLLATLSQAISDELRFARDIVVAADESFTYTSANFGEEAALVATDGRVRVQVAGAAPLALVGSGIYSTQTATVAAHYVREEACFRVRLTISDANDVLREQTYYVRALNPPA